MMSDVMTLAERIIALRKARGFPSQYALARAAGVSVGYIQKLERGDVQTPSAIHLAKVARCWVPAWKT